MTIWANTIVYNEENFIWFAVMSVVDYVDKVLIYDTGSNDKTVEIIEQIKKIKGEKIIFKEVGPIDKDKFPKMRQAMLEQSKCDWILILDGDEIWWKDSIKKLVNEIEENEKAEEIVVPMIIPVGDIYHIQEEEAGKYQILGKRGHINLRAFNKNIPGLHVDQPYGKEGYFDNLNKPIQERKDVIFINAPYLHLTHLKRSTKKRANDKFKLEIGHAVTTNFRFPEVFSDKYPLFISYPWVRLTGISLLAARLLTPLRKIKRRISQYGKTNNI